MSQSPLPRTGRKVRGDAKLEHLSPAQQATLRFWLADENFTYREVVEFIRMEFGLVVGRSAVALYYQRHILPARYVEDTATAAFLASLPEGDFDSATLKHVRALAFSVITRPAPNLDILAKLLDIVRRAEKQQLAEKRLALETRRVALREALASPPRRPRPHARSTHAPAPTTLPPATSQPSPSPAASSPPASAASSPSNPAPRPDSPAPFPQIPPNPPLFPDSAGLFPSPAPHPLALVLPPFPGAEPPPHSCASA